jgi:hypothetical protein
MPPTIPNLWPEDIKVDVLSPLAILRAQAGLMGQMTRGLIEAEVTTTATEHGRVEHQLDLIAPALDGYRQRILIASHDEESVYPVGLYWYETDDNMEDGDAYNDDEFIQAVGKALRSGAVRAVIASLIYRSNERTATTTGEHEQDTN